MNKYCFCIIRNMKEDGKPLLSNDQYVIRHKDIGMVVKDVEEEDVLPSGDEILKHEKTIEKIMENNLLIPMSFGNIAKNDEDVKAFLSQNYTKLTKLLKKFENRMEVGLKIFWTNESFADEVEDQQVKKLKEDIMKEKSISELRISEIGRLVEANAERKRDYYEKQIFYGLSSIAHESKLNTAHVPKMILNAAFLVDKDKENAFESLLNNIYEKYKDRLIFKYSGPWPPYNFVDEMFMLK
ncbi:MAG: GvpL/GvpF family gas vesicle protein [Bacillota bacterium]